MFHWHVGRVLGFPVAIKPGFFLLLLIVALGGFGQSGGLFSIGLMAFAFASVLAHELGHAWVARRRGVGISGIDLGFFGGAAKMTSLPRNARDEIAIAAAGPLVSLVLAATGFGIANLVGNGPIGMTTLGGVARLLGYTNLAIALFNLLPALPMDGGRILRAFLSRFSSYVTATDRAVTIARGFAVVFAIGGLLYSTQLLLLAPLLWLMGSRERWLARAMAPRYRKGRFGYELTDVEVMPFGFTVSSRG